MKKKQFKMTRRQLLKAGMIGGAGLMLPLRFFPRKAFGVPAAAGLSDPALQPKFVELAPNALDPAFLFKDLNENSGPAQKPNFSLRARQTTQQTGLIDPKNGRKLNTKVWGYGADTVSWPGQTIQVKNFTSGGNAKTVVRWENELGNKHLLPVDENLHWCYSLHGASSANGVDYRQYSIRRNGVPIITHLHGGNTDFQYDGNPEFFYSPDGGVKGPQWDEVPGGFTNTFLYDNDVPAGNLWYHDHALGITRLNVYAGLAGFYFVRDSDDTGLPGNSLGLPAFPYELAYAIQDRMFTDKGALFYPAFPGDPFYDDFIETPLPPEFFPGGGPTALAEFFGDHMVVNGKIWPKTDVMPRNYRMHLLNGTDSRFLVVQFVAVDPGVTNPNHASASAPLDFWVIGSDQGLGAPAQTNTLVIEPGGRYDVVVDFKDLQGKRVIMKNLGGDAPFGGDYGGDLEPADLFPDRQTDRIMAFDVADVLNEIDSFNPANLPGYGDVPNDATTRRVALFEGLDEFGRLQPLLGVEGDGTDINGNVVSEWRAIAWHSPTTEKPVLGSTEKWEIYNFTGDAHPIHLHLVNFEIRSHEAIIFDDTGPPQAVLQHNGEYGEAPSINNVTVGAAGSGRSRDEYFEDAPKDMVTVLPGERSVIQAEFNKSGRYVWHCHILSHEDHEMMRVLQVE
jgi:FtsP/CotA-like multicopper oxidase with cupredoxin domain